MTTAAFTPEKLMENLKTQFAYLNDNDVKATEVYDLIMSKQPK